MKIPPPQLTPIAVCYKSILSVHSETGNIWTHLICCLAFFFIFLWFLTSRLDTHIQFQMIAVMSFTAIVVLLWNKFNVKLYRPLRASIFSCIGLSVTETLSTTMTMDLPSPRYRKLQAELKLVKTKRVHNPHGNRWKGTNTTATIEADGLSVSNKFGAPSVFAEQSFPISVPHCRMDKFPGTILYYYEVKGGLWCYVGLSDDAIYDHHLWIGRYSNSYAIPPYHLFDRCWLAGATHRLELPVGATRPEIKEYRNVYGCGLVLDPDNKLAIFFTLNGKLLGRKISISPTVDRLFPAVRNWNESTFVANFGDNPKKPFVYDIQNCPGLELACI